jgi:hypothetical protein
MALCLQSRHSVAATFPVQYWVLSKNSHRVTYSSLMLVSPGMLPSKVGAVCLE